MNAGRRDHRLIVDEPIETQDASGAMEVTWNPITTVWAGIEPLRGREALTSNQILAEMDTRITILWSVIAAQITAKHRFRHQSTVYNIVSLAETNMGRRDIECLCKSGLNNG